MARAASIGSCRLTVTPVINLFETQSATGGESGSARNTSGKQMQHHENTLSSGARQRAASRG
jgi:hypothetical protein